MLKTANNTIKARNVQLERKKTVRRGVSRIDGAFLSGPGSGQFPSTCSPPLKLNCVGFSHLIRISSTSIRSMSVYARTKSLCTKPKKKSIVLPFLQITENHLVAIFVVLTRTYCLPLSVPIELPGNR